MQIKIIEDQSGSQLFDEKAHHPLQSWAWGEARKKMGIAVLRIGEFQKNKLTDVYQLTFHKIPFTNYKIGYLPRSVWPSSPVLQFLSDYGKKHNCVFIKLEPYVIKTKFHVLCSMLHKSSHPLFPEWTQILDLKKSEEDLLKNMHYKTRYNIRLAQKKGVVVKEMSDNKGFQIFSKLYFTTCKRQKYFGHNYQYHQIIWESLKNNIARILVAFYQKVPLAAFELFYFRKIFYYPYGGTSLEHRNLMASNLLMWEAIKLAKKLGAEKFDMWGSLGPDYDSNHLWAGFTRFKEGYAGKFTQMVGSFDLVINPTLYNIYNQFFRLRDIYLKILKSI